VKIRGPVIALSLAFLVANTAHSKLAPDQVGALPPAATRKVDFQKDIKPIFDASCIKCHGRGRVKAGFQLDSKETVLKGGDSGPGAVIGKSEESLVIELVSGLNPESVMPKKGSRLTPEQVSLLRAWIDQGMIWDSNISFGRLQPLNLSPRKPQVNVSLSSGENPIDQILRPYFQKHGFRLPPPVSDRVFARRAYLDLLGLPPPLDGPAAFVTDEDPGMRARLVRSLLGNNRGFAENWLSFWNDLLRNDYQGTGYIDGGRKPITDWLFNALVNNLPYDQFVAQLINPTPASEGFTKGIIWRGVVNASQIPAMQAAQNISQVFMGVNLKCASCHDSFINDWRLSDAYGLASIYSDGPLEMFQCDKPTGVSARARFIYPELGGIDPKTPRSERLKQLAGLITSPKDGRLSRTIVNRLWARLFGRGLVEPVDDMEQPAWNPDLLDWLAEDLVAHGYDLKHTLEMMATSKAYQLPASNFGESAATEYVFQGPAIRRLSAEEFRDAVGRLTGIWYRTSRVPGASQEVRCSLVPADPLAVALGRPNREQVSTTRASAATTLQALELTNGKTLSLVLQRAALRMVEYPPATDDLVESLYRKGLGRSPSGAEKQLAGEVVGSPPQPAGVEDLLWAMVMLPEFQLVY
jgi:mono/diheme cytochrome c family protein